MRRPPWALTSRFTQAEVAAAYAAMADPTALRFSAPSLSPYGSHRKAPQRVVQKQHMDIPLAALGAGSPVRAALPDPVLRIYEGLLDTAMRYAEDALSHPSVLPGARQEVLHGLTKRSVLRLLRYERGVGCRPHVDPGLCTCLLMGSHGGLEVNTQTEGATSALSVQGQPGNYRHDTGDDTEDAEGHNRLDQLPGWCSPVCEPPCHGSTVEEAPLLLTMNGNMLEVVSRGALPGVLHRVRYDWARESGSGDNQEMGACNTEPNARSDQLRSNIIVELRPASPKRWYRLAAAAAAAAAADEAAAHSASST